jgi:hypothetical protein
MFYLVEKEKAKQIAIEVMIQPTIQHIQNSWGIIERSPVVKNALKSILDPIKTNYKLYLPRIFEPVTLGGDAHTFVSLPSSLMYDRLMDYIFTKKPKQSHVKVRLLSKQKRVMRDTVESIEFQEIINKFRKEELRFVNRQIQ